MVRPAAPLQPSAVGNKAAGTGDPAAAGAPVPRLPTLAAFRPAQTGSAMPKEIMTSSASPGAGGSKVPASGTARSSPDAVGQGQSNGAQQGAQQGQNGIAAMATAALSAVAGTLSGEQQRKGVGPSAGVPSWQAANPPAVSAATAAPSSASDAARAKSASVRPAVVAQPGAPTALAAVRPSGAVATTPAAGNTARKWQPSPKMQAALVPDGKAAPPGKAASQAAVKPEPPPAKVALPDAAELRGAAPGSVASKAAEVRAEAGGGRVSGSAAKKRQRPAKLAAMSAAAAPAVTSADGKAPPTEASGLAAAGEDGERSHVAIKAMSAAAAPALQRPQPAAQQRLQLPSGVPPIQRTAASLASVKAEPRQGSSKQSNFKVRASLLKKEARPDSRLGAKREGGPPSRAASAELPATKRAHSRVPGADAVPGKLSASARAPSGPLPSTLQHSSSAGQLAEPAAKVPVRTTIVPASPEWGAAPPPATARPMERRTQIGGSTARPALLASIKTVLANAAGEPFVPLVGHVFRRFDTR